MLSIAVVHTNRWNYKDQGSSVAFRWKNNLLSCMLSCSEQTASRFARWWAKLRFHMSVGQEEHSRFALHWAATSVNNLPGGILLFPSHNRLSFALRLHNCSCSVNAKIKTSRLHWEWRLCMHTTAHRCQSDSLVVLRFCELVNTESRSSSTAGLEPQPLNRSFYEPYSCHQTQTRTSSNSHPHHHVSVHN